MDSSSPLVSATIGLFGVVVGGLLPVVVSYAHQKGQDRRLAKQTTRVLDDELLAAQNNLVLSLAAQRVVEDTLPECPPTWMKNRESLALSLTATSWRSTSLACAALRDIERSARREVTKEGVVRLVEGEEDWKAMQNCAEMVRVARSTLLSGK
jgi:hypothetical protein